MTQPLPGYETVAALATALGIGLLIGAERERSPGAKAGVRTFGLVALLGALASVVAVALGSGWVVAAGLLAMAGMIVTANAVDASARKDPGTTTAVALLVAYLLGALCGIGERQLAVMAGIATTSLLYFKPELEGFLQRFQRRDLLSVLQFAVVSFIVLPYLPDRGYGPWQALNPHRVWLMVVLVVGIGLAGYVALRSVGGRRGALYVGGFGGLVSSTATTLAYASLGADPATARLAARVIVVANLVVFARVLVVAAAVSPPLAATLAVPLGAALAAGLLFAVADRGVVAAADDDEADGPIPETANPTELSSALAFGALFAAVLVLSAWLTDVAGARGLYLVALASGLVDVDAITLSTGQLSQAGSVGVDIAATAVALALAANQAVKLAFVAVRGGSGLLRRVLPPLAVSGLVALAGTVVARAL